MTRRLLLLVAVFLAACGVKSRPFPPELVQPEPPSDLVAKSAHEGMRLTWRRPTKYSSGKHMRDLGGFDVERATDGAFTVVGTITLTDQTRFRQESTVTWTDTSPVADTTYTYRIVATTMDGYRSAPSEPVTLVHHPGATAEAPAPKPAPKPSKRRRPAP